jgi:SAM-dependent methyltransferase
MINNKKEYVIKEIISWGLKPKILEIGCADDWQDIDALSSEYYGVDIISANPPKNYLEKNLEKDCKLPYEDQSFDIIIALDVIEHLSNRHNMMKEIKRVLRPNGMFIISLPNEFSYQPVWYHIKHVEWMTGDSDIGHKHMYGMYNAPKFIGKYFKIRKIKYLYLDGRLNFLGRINQWLANKIPRWFGRNMVYSCGNLSHQKVNTIL